jgi:hypothetical protein
LTEHIFEAVQESPMKSGRDAAGACSNGMILKITMDGSFLPFFETKRFLHGPDAVVNAYFNL